MQISLNNGLWLPFSKKDNFKEGNVSEHLLCNIDIARAKYI
jgi:hypothetical protein